MLRNILTSPPPRHPVSHIAYRPEIDGLRAIALLPVILFHAGLPYFSGGFYGVDIFFVISGYLITKILLKDLEEGHFSLAAFYERRARRILPALLVMVAACLPFAWLWMPPNRLMEFFASVAATGLFASNLYFWQQTDYFAAAAEQLPLLHTWSLAVEEQYYLLFPIILYLCWRGGKGPIALMVALLLAASLTSNLWLISDTPEASFFLPHARLWELLAGSLCAYVHFRKGHYANEFFALTGLGLILFALLDYGSLQLAPGLFAVVPVSGTALLLLYAPAQTVSGRLLSLAPLRGIGLISYSAYLWHQPLFAFARIRTPLEPSQLQLTGLAVASLMLGYLSWRFVEQPFRGKNPWLPERNRLFIAAFIGLAGLVAIGGWGYWQQGVPGRFTLPPGLQQSFMKVDDTKRKACFQKPNAHLRDDWTCRVGDAPDNDFFLFGDSHALSLLEGFERAARHAGKGGQFAGLGTCPPLLGIYRLGETREKYNCHALNERVFEFVKKHNIPKLFLAARWSHFTEGGYSGKNFTYLGESADDERSQAHSRHSFERALARTINAYREIGTELTIIRQVPEQISDPKQSYLKIFSRKDVPAEVAAHVIAQHSIPRAEHDALQAFFDQSVQPYAGQKGLQVISFDPVFCNDSHCPLGEPFASYYHDSNHLSVRGARSLTDQITSLLD